VEDKIRSELQAVPGLVFFDEHIVLREAMAVFPFAHGSPNWKEYYKHISVDWDGTCERALKNIENIRQSEGIVGDISYIGDGLTRFSFTFGFQYIDFVFKIVFGIPQHHYFFNIESGWMCRLSFENDFDVGLLRRPA